MRQDKMTGVNHYIKTISYTLSYTCLLACGLYFSKDAINQYQERKTAFHITEHQLTIDDLPFITICYQGLTYNAYMALRLNSSVVAKDWMIYYELRVDYSDEGKDIWDHIGLDLKQTR